jgi:CHAT domain-containing protein
MAPMQALENSRLFYFGQMEELYWTHMGIEMDLSRIAKDPFPFWQAVQQWKAISLSEVLSRSLAEAADSTEIQEPISMEHFGSETRESISHLLSKASSTEVVKEDDIYTMAEIAEKYLAQDGSIIFVDWVRYHDTLFLTAFNGTSTALIKRVVELDYSKIEQWVKDNLGVEDLSQGRVVRKRLMRTSKLTELRPIIEGLESFIESNDLVVLCPAAILHALPLHAIPFGPEGKPLIISNPVVYSASNALLWRCVSKAHQMAFQDTNGFRAAAFTRLGPHDPREEMRMKQTAQAAMKYFEKSTLAYGRMLTRERFIEEARGVNLLHYNGHAYLEASERKNRALVLEPTVSNNGLLSVMDVFELQLKVALVVLLACASGEEDIAPNDDPLGMISAFIYAGAASVIATLWPTQTSDARAFAERFYAYAFGQRQGSSVYLAKALQKTVQDLWEERDEDEPYHWAQFELCKLRFRDSLMALIVSVTDGAWFCKLPASQPVLRD